MRPSLTIIADQSVDDYAKSLETIFQLGGINTVRTSPLDYKPAPEEIGDPASLFDGSDYAVLIVSGSVWEQVYASTGYRATLDAAARARERNFFVVLTENLWIPGFHARHVFIDLQARNAIPIAAEITRFMKDMNFSMMSLPSDTPSVVRTDTEYHTIYNYLSDLCVLSDYAGVIAFGAVVYEDGQEQVLQMLSDKETVAELDLLAGPHLDLFAIADTSVVAKAEIESEEPQMKTSSVFMEQCLGLENIQLHYPSLVVFLIEQQVFAHAATVPIIYLEDRPFIDEFRSLVETIARGLRLWRLEPEFDASDVWSYLLKTLRKDNYPVTELLVQIDTGKAIDLFARSIRYF